jgi:hypothetical protein
MILEYRLVFNFHTLWRNCRTKKVIFSNFVLVKKRTQKCQHWRGFIGIIIFNFSTTLRNMATVILVEAKDPSKAILLFKLIKIWKQVDICRMLCDHKWISLPQKQSHLFYYIYVALKNKPWFLSSHGPIFFVVSAHFTLPLSIGWLGFWSIHNSYSNSNLDLIFGDYLDGRLFK